MANFSTKSRFFVPLLIVAVVLVSGCVNQAPTEVGTLSGTQGLAVSFFQGAPPLTLGEGETFEIGVNLENLGSHDIPIDQVAIYLKGVNPLNFGYGTAVTDASNQALSSTLIAAQEIDGQIVGGQDALTWNNLCYEVDLNTDQSINFIAQSCYVYNTSTRFDACFNVNPYKQTTGTETCSVTGEKFPVNADSPVQITSVSESPAGQDKFRFIVKVANSGGGQVYDRVKGTTCIDNAVQDLNRVNIDRITVGTQVVVDSTATIPVATSITSNTWLLDGTNPYLKLSSGVGQFIFTYQPTFPAGTSVYSEPIEVELSYGYSDQISRSISVSSIPGVPDTTTGEILCDGDGDGLATSQDNCPFAVNAGQGDVDLDDFGNACDDDIDGDGVPNTVDTDDDADGIFEDGETAEGPDGTCSTSDDNTALYGVDVTCGTLDDTVGDGIIGSTPCSATVTVSCDDNCPIDANPLQTDTDADGIGDVCDL